MLVRKLMIPFCLLTAALVTAQTQPASPAKADAAKPAAAAATTTVPEGGMPTYIRPETPEQRKARLGTAEDPGINPDREKHYWRFGREQHIERYERRWAVYEGGEEGTVRPFGFVNVYKEIYQQNDKYVWVWHEDVPPEDADAAAAAFEAATFRKFSDDDLAFLQKIRSEFSELTPPASDVTVRFEESSAGLPTSGSWRNSLAVADMNGDGFVDIIAPPERAGNANPSIFLGDGNGHWKFWKEAKWPHGLDYGSVAAADFNKDGHMDLAFGVHLNGVYVFEGDGKGNFTEVTTGVTHDFATRRVLTADVDHDGYMDVVAISEGPTAVQRVDDAPGGRIRAYLNRKKGTAFESVSVADPVSRFGGDWMSTGNFNGDEYPDFVGASIFFNGADIMWLSNGLKKWQPVRNSSTDLVVPYISYYGANTVGRFSKMKTDEIAVAYSRFWPGDLDPHLVPTPPAKIISGVDRISFPGGHAKRTPIVRWVGGRMLAAMGSGDFDGDGNADLIYTNYDPRAAVYLRGDGKGGFTRAKLAGVTLDPNTNYDVRVADVNGDGRPDLIVMYETTGKTAFAVRDGSIHVFLNRGPVTAPATAATTK
jgi:hypothetical protein